MGDTVCRGYWGFVYSEKLEYSCKKNRFSRNEPFITNIVINPNKISLCYLFCYNISVDSLRTCSFQNNIDSFYVNQQYCVEKLVFKITFIFKNPL